MNPHLHAYESTYETEASDGTVTASIECRILYHVHSFGSSEHIPPYNRPDLYDPGSGPEIEVVKVLVETFGPDGETVWRNPEPELKDYLQDWAEGLEVDLVYEAAATEQDEREAALELRADERREAREP